VQIKLTLSLHPVMYRTCKQLAERSAAHQQTRAWCHKHKTNGEPHIYIKLKFKVCKTIDTGKNKPGASRNIFLHSALRISDTKRPLYAVAHLCKVAPMAKC